VANIKSAKKRARQAVKRNARNSAQRSEMRTAVKKTLKVIESGDKAAATDALRTAESKLAHFAGKGLVHRNKAARTTSRLVKRLRAMA
jgi:small subunit ribosomal protein S20